MTTLQRPSRSTGQLMLSDLFSKAERQRAITACAKDLRALAEKRKRLTGPGEVEWGVTAQDTRAIAIRLGFSTGHESEAGAFRALSWLAAVPKAAGLKRTDRTRLNHQRNAQRVFVL